jgi:hypothetical protein
MFARHQSMNGEPLLEMISINESASRGLSLKWGEREGTDGPMRGADGGETDGGIRLRVDMRDEVSGIQAAHGMGDQVELGRGTVTRIPMGAVDDVARQ